MAFPQQVFCGHPALSQFYELSAQVNFQTCAAAKFKRRVNYPLAQDADVRLELASASNDLIKPNNIGLPV
jgi:hypothetical protein